MNPEIIGIIDRIIAGTDTKDDIARLRGAVRVNGDGNTVQIGEGNINIGQGRDIHIGDRTYQGASAEEIRAVFHSILDEQSQPIEVDWDNECRKALEQRRNLTTNPLTGENRALDSVYVPLGLVTRKTKPKVKEEISPREGSNIYHPERNNGKEESQEEHQEVTKKFSKEQFFNKVLHQEESPNSKGRRLAIIGEPGAGKTTLLQKIADWVLEETERGVAIWVSLGDLRERTLNEYLETTWLKNRLAISSEQDIKVNHRKALEELFKTGRVWLLLDGVDEIGIDKPLYKIAQQIKDGLVAQAKIVLTCRQNVWDLDKKALYDFDVYRNLDFEPEQVHQFIDKWFISQSELRENLWRELSQSGKERVRDLVRNPLRLTLLCLIWGEEGEIGELPNTKAGLYEKFIEQFYQWKDEYFGTNAEITQQKLNQKLGELARKAIDEENSPFKLRESLVCEVLGEKETSLFQKLVKQISWLNLVGNDGRENIYAFFHPSFQEYFAAFAVDDWRFFLNHDSGNPNPTLNPNPSLEYDDGKPSYRFFEPQWNEVIQLWFGRKGITREEKEKFINQLQGFQDGLQDLYKCRLLPLLTAGVNEYSNGHCSENDDELCQWLIKQLCSLYFGYFDEREQCWILGNHPLKEQGMIALQQMERTKVIKTLANIVKDEKAYDWIRLLAVEFILEIDPENQILPRYDVKNDNSIDAIVKYFINNKYATKNDFNILSKKGLYCLLKIKPVGNKPVINALIVLLGKYREDQNIPYEYLLMECLKEICINDSNTIQAVLDLFFDLEIEIENRYLISEVLNIIALGNLTAIERLLKWILNFLSKNTDDEEYKEYDCYSYANLSIRELANRNETAINTLISWLGNISYSERIHQKAFDLLGSIAKQNSIAIQALLDKIREYNPDYNTLNQAISCLTRIGIGSQEEVTCLLELLNRPETNDNTRSNIVDYFRDFGSESQEFILNNQDAINIFFDLLKNINTDESFREEVFDCLEKISPGNEKTDNALVSLLINTNIDKDTRNDIAYLLNKKASINSQAINEIVSWILYSNIDEDERLDIAESLNKSLVGNQRLITQLVQQLLNDEIDSYNHDVVISLLKKIDSNREISIIFLVSKL